MVGENVIRTNRKCTCCTVHFLVIVRNATVMAANWEGIKVK